MTNLFTYTKTEGQGWLVEKPEMKKPVMIVNAPKHLEREIYERFSVKWKAYIKNINSLRRFKYDYPDPGKEMELGKDFVVTNEYGKFNAVAVPMLAITQRTYSEQDYWSLVGELKGTLRGIIDFYNPNPKVKESLEKRIKELEALKLNNPL